MLIAKNAFVRPDKKLVGVGLNKHFGILGNSLKAKGKGLSISFRVFSFWKWKQSDQFNSEKI